MGRLLAFLYASAGIVGFASDLLPSASGHRTHVPWLLAEDSVAVLLGPWFLRMRRDTLWPVGASTALATAMVSLRVYLIGDNTLAITSGMFYLLIVLPAFFFYSRPVAWSQGACVGAVALLVLHNKSGLGAAELALGAGVAAILAVVGSWLVRASDLAETDYLTGLLNRRGFEPTAQSALQQADGRRALALMVIDLDGFSAVNDRYEYAVGNGLLHSISQRWQRALPEGALLARHGGDEFTVLLRAATENAVDQALGSMRAAARTVTFCAGVAWSVPGESLTMLTLRANAAMYEAKRRGPGQTVVAPAPGSTRSGQDVIDAVAAGQFVLYYQPIVGLRTGAVDKAEALLRWIHPVDGVISPDDFIPLAEQTGVMVELGDWVLMTACRDAANWIPNAEGLPIGVSVNASGIELQDPSYADRVLGHLHDAGLPTNRLVVEVVESDYNLNSATVRANLATLVTAGISLAIDDFGTGHSSLSRLDQIDVQLLKIDRSFVRTLTHENQQMPVITAILGLAHALGLQVVAEGVETPEQAAWLRNRGCSHAQGYLYGKPTPNPFNSND